MELAHDVGKARYRRGQLEFTLLHESLTAHVDGGNLRRAATDEPGIECLLHGQACEQGVRDLERHEVRERAHFESSDRLAQRLSAYRQNFVSALSKADEEVQKL